MEGRSFGTAGGGAEAARRTVARRTALTANVTASKANAPRGPRERNPHRPAGGGRPPPAAPANQIPPARGAGPATFATVRVPWNRLFASWRSRAGTVSGRNALRAGIANARAAPKRPPRTYRWAIPRGPPNATRATAAVRSPRSAAGGTARGRR